MNDNDVLADVTTALGGRYLPDPLWTKEGGKSLITVHPLGGCVMADDATRGVVDDVGRVFSSANGTDVHDGLVVCDGSIIPRPLDVNPLLTIAALAERTASSIGEKRGWNFETAPDRTPAPESSTPVDRVGIRFTERMAGWFRIGATEYAAGERAGKSGIPRRHHACLRRPDRRVRPPRPSGANVATAAPSGVHHHLVRRFGLARRPTGGHRAAEVDQLLRRYQGSDHDGIGLQHGREFLRRAADGMGRSQGARS